jgi:DNA invertase Pin-like site-specific DNA recombinase
VELRSPARRGAHRCDRPFGNGRTTRRRLRMRSSTNERFRHNLALPLLALCAERGGGRRGVPQTRADCSACRNVLAGRLRDDADMGSPVGYARVSTVEQDPALQHDALTAAGCVRVFTDTASGARDDRAQLTAALDYLRAGDTLVVWRLDRLGRSLPHLINTITALEQRQIGFRSLTEAIDTTTAGGRLLFAIMAALAEFERQLIRERTMAGLQAAAERGRRGGRPSRLSEVQVEHARTLRAQGSSLSTIAELLGVSKSTAARACGPAPAGA